MKDVVYIIGNVLLTILVLLLLIALFVFVENKMMLNDNIEVGKYIIYQQTDNTMEEDFSINDIVVFQKDNTYQIGDVVIYKDSTHKDTVGKIVGLNEGIYSVKCNTCNSVESLTEYHLIAKAVGKVAEFGKVVNILKSKFTLITLAVVGFFSLIVSQSMTYKPKIEKI